MRVVFALASAVVLILLSVAPAAATPPQPVTIELWQECIDGQGCVVPSPFEAKGPAVEAGLICPSGLAHNVGELTSGPGMLKSRLQIVTHTTKQFDCADGSGSFVLSISYHIKLRFTPLSWSSVGPWNVDTGTGDYERLHGTGSVESWPEVFATLFHDLFTGEVHID